MSVAQRVQLDAELRAFEPFVRRFYAPTWMRLSIAADNDDVRNECRIAAWRALGAAKAKNLTGIDRLRFVRRSIARAFVDLIRKANAKCRRVPDWVFTSLEAGTADGSRAGEPTPEPLSPELEYLKAERQAAIQATVAEIRRIVGSHLYEQLLSVHGDVGSALPYSKTRSVRGEEGLQNLRQKLSVRSLSDVERAYGDRMLPRPIESLTDIELTKVCLIHGSKIKSVERPYLLKETHAILDAPSGSPQDFPACFGSAMHFDPKDSQCMVECDFNQECRAVLGGHPEVESAFLQLKPSSKKMEAVKPAISKPLLVDPDPTDDEDLDAEPPIIPDDDDETTLPSEMPAVPEEDEEPSARVKTETTGKRTKKAKQIMKPQKAVKTAKEAPSSAPPKLKKVEPPKGKPKRGRVVADVVAPPPAKGENTMYFLTKKRGVLPKGQSEYKLIEGRRQYHAPQGSATEAALLPIGYTRQREWKGVTYLVKKITDGVWTENHGYDRKRDGTWEIVWRQPSTGKNEGKKIPDGFVGTLTKIAFRISDNRNWSGARFFGIVGTSVLAQVAAENPELKLAPIYAVKQFGKRGPKPKAKAPTPEEKAAKPVARPSTKAKTKKRKKRAIAPPTAA